MSVASPSGPRPHPWFARLYGRISVAAEKRGVDQHRKRLLSGLTGDVVEVGAGNGLNFCHYPETVCGVQAIEPEPSLREAATAAADCCATDVTVVDGHAAALPLEDGIADGVVVSLVLCSVESQATALEEIFRVLRPGGELRFYEHVVAHSPAWRRWQHRADPVWTRFAGGCHLTRDTAAAIRAAGFVVDECDEFVFSTSVVDRLAAQHILGRAHRPALNAEVDR